MKIWSRIGAEQGGPQPRVSISSADTKARLLRPLTVVALTREGGICEQGRTSGGRFLRPGSFSKARLSPTPPASIQTALLTKKLPKIERFFAKQAPTSNRKWTKSRCYRKQTTKPSLTEARTAIKELAKS